jgi:hypothetical protein
MVFSRLLQQDSQSKSMYNVTRRDHATTDAVEKKEVLHIPRERVHSLRYLACNAHAPHCRLLNVRLYNIFLHYLIKDNVFKITLLNIKCVFCSPLQILSETLLTPRTI